MKLSGITTSLSSIIFLWLDLSKQNHIWDLPLHKIWSGPTICSLCKEGNESINHIFISCSHIYKMWEYASQVCGHPFMWTSLTLEQALASWTINMNFKHHLVLLFIFIWGVWLAKNTVVF